MARLIPFVEQTQADEVMITTMIYDHAARRHSYELLAQAFGSWPLEADDGRDRQSVRTDSSVDSRTRRSRRSTSSAALRIERHRVSRGQARPPGFWYDQPQERVGDRARRRRRASPSRTEARRRGGWQPGDCMHIAAHRRHRVAWTDPTQATVWLAVHYGPGMLK